MANTKKNVEVNQEVDLNEAEEKTVMMPELPEEKEGFWQKTKVIGSKVIHSKAAKVVGVVVAVVGGAVGGAAVATKALSGDSGDVDTTVININNPDGSTDSVEVTTF